MTVATPAAVGAALLALVLSGCGGGGSAKHSGLSAAAPTTASSSTPASLDPSACAGVTRETPIEKVSPGCRALWSGYHVTVVPPFGLSDRVPQPPRVENRTGGAVTDAQARQWALDANRANVWFQWAEANDQVNLLDRVVSTSLLSPDEARILRTGGRVFQPNCVLFPVRVRLFPVDSAARTYFTEHGKFSGDKYVFVNTYRPRCTVTDVTGSGKRSRLATLTTSSVAFNVGSVQGSDSLLGEIWFQTAFGSCTDQGRPAAWCTG